MNISVLRRQYHNDVVQNILRINKSKAVGGYPNFADGGNVLSVTLAWGVAERLANAELIQDKLPGQTVGSLFEITTRDFLEQSFAYLHHLRPGKWNYECRDTKISKYVQYDHLNEIEEALDANKALKAAFGGNYVVGPDIVISRTPVSDEEINSSGILSDEEGQHAIYTPLRAANQRVPRPLLHAVISCKWTLRNDRAQNTKIEVLNLIRHRKGNLPHIVAVTAEPLPSRIAALALGTGDLDCVYHFALNELMSAVADSPYLDAAELLQMMVDGKRLRDISDLPFDLAV